MRLIFLGSPQAVVAPLAALLDDGPSRGHTVVGVVSQPARPVGRGHELVDPPVAAFAKSRGVPTLQPEKASDPAFLDAFRALAPDVAITAAYGQILNEAFLAIPKRGTINIHPSLLPAYRGATPVQAALLAGEAVSGVTVLFTVRKLDAGAIIVQEASPIAPDESAEALLPRYFAIGARLLWPALERLSDAAFTGTPQNEAKATHCRKIEKTDGLITWKDASEDIYNRFRAFDPWPGTYTFHAGRRILVTAMARGADTPTALAPGELVFDKKQHALVVGTGDGVVHVLRLRAAGGKEINAAAFWNGLKERSNVLFTSVGP